MFIVYCSQYCIGKLGLNVGCPAVSSYLAESSQSVWGTVLTPHQQKLRGDSLEEISLISLEI